MDIRDLQQGLSARETHAPDVAIVLQRVDDATTRRRRSLGAMLTAAAAVVLIAGGISVAVSNQHTSAPPSPSAASTALSAADVSNIRWSLTMISSGSTNQPIAQSAGYWIELRTNGDAIIMPGCDPLTGTWQITGNGFTVDHQSDGLIACAPETTTALQGAHGAVAGLDGPIAAHLQGTKLVIENGSTTLQFTNAGPAQ